MKTYFPTTLLVSSLMLAFPFSGTTAQKNQNQAQQVKQAKTELDAAQDKLRDARQELDKAQKEYNTALTAQQAAATLIQKARQVAAQRVGPKFGLPAAQTEHTLALSQVTTTRAALLATLKAQSDYQAATKAADTAREKMLKLGDDTTLTDEQRTAKNVELSGALRHPAEIQKLAEAGDAPLQEAQRRFRAAEQQLASVMAQVQKAIADDVGIKDALEKAKDAQSRLTKAKDALAKEQVQFNTAQTAVNREQQQYQQAQAQDKKKKKK